MEKPRQPVAVVRQPRPWAAPLRGQEKAARGAAVCEPAGRGSGFCLAAEHLLEFARLVHLHHDVRAADELALHVQLRDGGPVAVFLDALADLLVFQHVHRGHGLGVHAAGLEDLDGAAREAAHREAGASLHEQQDVVGLDEGVDALLGVVAHGLLL